MSGKWGIGGRMILGRIERRKGICNHRRGKTAGGGSDMTWQGYFVCATQFAYTFCISVMDTCDALDLTRDSRLLRASCDDALENCNSLIVGGDGEGQV
jgi:hypothetical protein